MGGWWYVLNGERRGPVSEDELYQLLSSGALTADTLIWKSGMKGWEPAFSIDQLNSLLSSLPPDVPQRPGSNPASGAWRVTRLEYFFWSLGILGAVIVIGALGAVVPPSVINKPTIDGISVLVQGVLGLCILPLTVGRFHDVGR